jgi:hypothetical protein
MLGCLLLALLLQSQQLQTIRSLFGQTLPQAVELLKKQGPPPKKSPSINVFALDSQEIAGSVLELLSSARVTMKQMNIVFCPNNERVMAVQQLLSAASLTDVQQMYDLPDSLKVSTDQPAIGYPLAGVTYTGDGRWVIAKDAEPISVWHSGTTEIVFQPITTTPALAGQLWFTDKTTSGACAAGNTKQ